MKQFTSYNNHPKVIPFRQRKVSPYPNAADVQYYLDKITQFLLAAAIGAGGTTAMLILLFL